MRKLTRKSEEKTSSMPGFGGTGSCWQRRALVGNGWKSRARELRVGIERRVLPPASIHLAIQPPSHPQTHIQHVRKLGR